MSTTEIETTEVNSPTLRQVSQYTKELAFVAHVPAYESKERFEVSFQTDVFVTKTPHEGYWRVGLDVNLTGKTKDKALFDASVSLETVVVVENLPEGDALNTVLRVQVPARLFAHARSALNVISLGSGFGTITLPIVPQDYIAKAYRGEDRAQTPGEEMKQLSAPEENAQ